MKKTKVINKNIGIEKRFLEEIFNYKFEQLEKVFNLIRAFEKEYKYDLVKKLLNMVSEREKEFSFEYERYYHFKRSWFRHNLFKNLYNLIFFKLLKLYITLELNRL